MPSIRIFHLGDLAEAFTSKILCNQSLLVLEQKIKELSYLKGKILHQITSSPLSDKVEEIPDMYGWKRRILKPFAKWLNIEVEFEGSGSGFQESKMFGLIQLSKH